MNTGSQVITFITRVSSSVDFVNNLLNNMSVLNIKHKEIGISISLLLPMMPEVQYKF